MAGSLIFSYLGVGSLAIFGWGTDIYYWLKDSVYTPSMTWFASNWCGILSVAGVEQCDSSNWYYYGG